MSMATGERIELQDGIARCVACGWEGVPTCVCGDPVVECPRCEAAVEIDELGAGLSLKDVPRGPPPQDTRRGLESASGLAWAARDVLERETGRNDPCWCGSGLKSKRCHGSGLPVFRVTRL